MIDFVKKMLGGGDDERGGNGIHDTRIATCALLLEIAGVDGQISGDETARIRSLLTERFALGDEEASDLLEAAVKEREGSIDLWHFTNAINDEFSVEEKITVIEYVWEIIYVDGRLDSYEDYLVHKLSELLGLRHTELIDAKLRVKERLV